VQKNLKKSKSISIPADLYERLEKLKDNLTFDISSVCVEAIESEIHISEFLMKNTEERIIEIRKTQLKEFNEERFNHGREEGIAHVKNGAKLHVKNILFICEIETETNLEGRDWKSDLSQILYAEYGSFTDTLQELEDDKSFDVNEYCRGYIIGVKEGWKEIEAIVRG
jgi:predicted DNA-binding protein